MSRLILALKGRPAAAPPPPDPETGFGPAASWTGTAGSGFVTPPSDPTRTTAKPSVRPLFVPWLTFTDDIAIGFQVKAKGGIQKVIFHVEGSSVEVTAKTTKTYTDANGNTRSQRGYHVTLDHSLFAAISLTGVANLYVEAVPNNGAMQRRVMGPYKVYARAAEYDRSSTVGSGGTYATIKAAIDAGHALGFRRQKIEIVSSGEYQLGQVATVYANSDYWTTITHAPGVVAKIVGASAVEAVQPRHDGLRFRGGGVHLCLDRFGQLYPDDGSLEKLWFDGCTVENDSGSRNTLQNSGVPNTYWVRTTAANVYATDVIQQNTFRGLSYCQLVKNCTLTSIAEVALQNNACLHGVTVTDLDCTTLRTGINAMTVSYSGGSTTATLEVSNGPGNSRTLTLKENGSTITSGTFAITSASNGSTFVTVQQVVDFINGKSGWSATHLDGSRRGVQLSMASLVPSAAIPATSCKSTTITLTTIFDVHSDGVHHFGSGIENRNGEAISLINLKNAQGFFLDQSSTDIKDLHYSGLLVEKTDAVSIFSRIGSQCGHVTLDYATFVDQQFYLDVSGGFTADAYCQVANVAAEAINWAGTADADVTLNNLHCRTGSAPSGATNSTTGGTNALNFIDVANDNFAPVLGGNLLRSDGSYAGRFLPTGSDQ